MTEGSSISQEEAESLVPRAGSSFNLDAGVDDDIASSPQTGCQASTGSSRKSAVLTLALAVLVGVCATKLFSKETRISTRTGRSNVIMTGECVKSWGTFSEDTTLNATKVLSRSSESIFGKRTQTTTIDIELSDIERKGIFIYPQSQFAFCNIPGNAAKEWSTVLQKVLHNDTSIRKQDSFVAEASQAQFGGIEATKKIFSDPGATRVVMIRDPVTRFALTFLDKCFDKQCGNSLCYARDHTEKGQPISFRRALEWILDESTDVSTINVNWRLQSAQCGLQTNLQSYTIIGYVDPKTLNHDASCIMAHAGLGRFNVQSETDGASPFWMGDGMPAEEEILLKRLLTPELAKRLVTKFKKDYDLFHLPRPKWIEGANGDWLDSTTHHSCSTTRY